jgi:hypothetical protein
MWLLPSAHSLPEARFSGHSLAPADSPTWACLSTANYIQTAECNVGCNSAKGDRCADECLCQRATTNITGYLNRGLPSSEFRELVAKFQKNGGQQKPAPKIPALSASRRSDSAAPTGTAEAILSGLPDEMDGFWMKTWACKDQPKSSWACAGPKSKNINVVFSGYSDIANAIDAALFKDSAAITCTDTDKSWCESQAEFMVSTTHEYKTQAEALKEICKKPGFEICKRCFDPDTDTKDGNVTHPYAPSSGLYSGVPFLGIGGATGNGMITVEVLDQFTGHALATIQDAGFQGVAFDMELTGDGDIVAAQDRAFANVKRAGLLVMVTTSHSAPYAAASEEIKEALVESWIKSRDIDLFSPQMYTSGDEQEPEYDLTACGAPNADNPEASSCTYERLKPMHAKWIPSLASGKQYPQVKKWFAAKGITTHGFMQWGAQEPTR